MSILDDVLDVTEPGIYSVENDVDNIHIELDDLDSALAANIRRLTNAANGGWDAAEYGITAEEARKQLSEANTPEAKAKVLASLKERAKQRASLDVTNGKINLMVNVGKNGEKMHWHRLGTSVTGAVTSEQAAKLAGIDWEVIKVPANWVHNGQNYESKDTFLIVRKDTGAELGNTGKVYKPIQNLDAFSALDDALAEYGARYETAGSIYGGKTVWMQAVLPDHKWEVQNGDLIETYAMFAVNHNGIAACRCFPTTDRAVCGNTYRVAVGKAKNKGISIRHTGDIKSKIESVKIALGLAVKGFEAFKENAATMVKTKVNAKHFVNGLLDEVLDVSQEEMAMGLELLSAHRDKNMTQAYNYRKSVLEDILDRHESERCEPHGTLWGVFNAVTEHVDHFDHRQRGDKKEREFRKFESSLYGKGDDMKQIAYQNALELFS